jgi:thioredoxin reductase
MQTWLDHMPKGMRLKSEGFASSLSDPDDHFTLQEYCKENDLPYAHIGLPVKLETFASYGLEFQRRFVPQMETKHVTNLRRNSAGFHVTLSNGEEFKTKQVVMAVGLSHYAYTPEVLAHLPSSVCTHSSEHSVLDKFNGRNVIVLGGGASAADIAALLQQAGASPQIVARNSTLRFHDPPVIPRPLRDSLRSPMTGIGSGWKLVFYTTFPRVFNRLPEDLRLRLVRKTLGPAPGWFVKQDIVGKVPLTLGVQIKNARLHGDQVQLELTDNAGKGLILEADHVIAATGYKVDLRRLTFLDESLRTSIHSVEQTPILNRNFESSVPGLFFVGASSANSFGPMMRFAFGARYTATVITRHLGD